MGADQTPDWHDAVASALDWWRDAGVDVLVEDAPRDWFAAPVAAAPRAIAAPLAAAPAALPDSWDAFAAWRTGLEAPEAGWGSPLLPATGPADAALMVMVEMPERDDAREGRLLSGPSGRLLDRMLAAIGQSRDSVHLASVAAARPASGRIPRELAEPLAALARHHVGLVRPRLMLLLGNAPCQLLLGDLCHAARGRLRPLNQDGAIRAIASLHPQQLIERPQWKAESWKDLLMVKAELDA